MIDRLFGALLTFSLLAGGTTAIGSALFRDDAPARVVTLPAVTVIGQREPAKVARSDAAEPATTQVR